MSFYDSNLDKCILIIDDSATTICVANRILSDHGFTNIRSVEDPRAAETAIQQFQPDLILVDVIMPFVDGMTVLQSVKNRIQQGLTKVIMLSAVSDQRTIDTAFANGASLFIRKPFSPEDLIGAVEQVMSSSGISSLN